VKAKLLLVVAVGLALVAADKPDAKKEDKDAIQGTWTFVSGERNGEEPPDNVKSMKLTFKGDMVTAVVGDKTQEAKFTLDPSKKPKEISLTMKRDGQERTVHGIYELDGDTLKICHSEKDDGPLPKEFSGKKDSKQALMVFKRAK
jgi:uncharacterized protein (TIGR03067 family)